MKNIAIAVLLSTICMAAFTVGSLNGQDDTDDPQVTFKPIDIYIDSSADKLAAYQFELSASDGNLTIVGIEGGRHSAFANPPYYDPAALKGGRIIIAAFSTDSQLPTGKTKVATVHLMITGDAPTDYNLNLMAAGNETGKKINAEITAQ